MTTRWRLRTVVCPVGTQLVPGPIWANASGLVEHYPAAVIVPRIYRPNTGELLWRRFSDSISCAIRRWQNFFGAGVTAWSGKSGTALMFNYNTVPVARAAGPLTRIHVGLPIDSQRHDFQVTMETWHNRTAGLIRSGHRRSCFSIITVDIEKRSP